MSAPNTPQPQWQPDYNQHAAPQWQPPGPPPTGSPKRSGFPRWLIPVVVGVIALLIGIGIGGAGGTARADKTPAAAPKPGATVTATATQSVVSTVTATPPAPTATVTTTFTPTPVVAFSNGQYLVPTEVQLGTYHTDGATGCYYELLRDLNGSIDSIINNDNFDGPTTIQIGDGVAAIKSSGGCSWTKVG